MPALVAGIHVFYRATSKAWMAGTSPAMTMWMDTANGGWYHFLIFVNGAGSSRAVFTSSRLCVTARAVCESQDFVPHGGPRQRLVKVNER